MGASSVRCVSGFCRCTSSAQCCTDKDDATCLELGSKCASPPAGTAGAGNTAALRTRTACKAFASTRMAVIAGALADHLEPARVRRHPRCRERHHSQVERVGEQRVFCTQSK